MSHSATAAEETILVIDDESALRDILTQFLEHMGHPVLQAEDGEQGLALIRQQQPALVLCDIRMPGIDGLHLLGVVTEEFKDLPIILISGEGELTDAIQALKLGAWDYITKPARMAVLQHSVDRALERARLVRQNREYQVRLEATVGQLSESLDALQREEEAGRQIQFQMLPEDNRSHGPCLFNHKLLPSASLSGDFVDHFRIDEQRLGFYLADVSGHGVSSALVTVILKSTVTHYLLDFWRERSNIILDPVAVLDDLNKVLLDQNLEKYLTIFFGIIDLENNVLRFANGGQFPFPILFDGSSAQFIGQKSLPVGLFGHATYTLEEQSLSQRFLLALCSDGMLEVMPQEKIAEKEAQLLSMVNTMDITTDQLLDGVGVKDGATGLPDDITILLVRR